MRKSLVELFKIKFSIPLWWELIPEKATFPAGCYAISDDIIVREISGSGVSSHEVVFDVDIFCKTVEQVDLYRNLMLDLSGKSAHRYKDLFQILIVRSADDGGPYLGVTNDLSDPLHILSLKISLFE